ncbi:MAG: hypothetical protein IJS01_08065 [Lentisphaeria bacterium]|nr:hypothetical protein [Lentisphaeria bacterium]
MKNDREQQMLSMQRMEGASYVAGAIFEGWSSYKKFVSSARSAESREDVDNLLKLWLSAPENKGKIIPGFNDRPGDESGE